MVQHQHLVAFEAASVGGDHTTPVEGLDGLGADADIDTAGHSGHRVETFAHRHPGLAAYPVAAQRSDLERFARRWAQLKRLECEVLTDTQPPARDVANVADGCGQEQVVHVPSPPMIRSGAAPTMAFGCDRGECQADTEQGACVKERLGAGRSVRLGVS